MKLRFLACAALLSVTGCGGAYAQSLTATVTVDAGRPGPEYSRYIFSQFAEHLGTGIYGGVWVGEKSRIPNIRGYRTDVLEALKAIKVPMIRWPGGCFADEYHWREGIGPREQRPVKINTNWGGVTEDNSFGTHEFMDFAELVGADAYVSGNVGSGTPQEAAEWVEYMTATQGSLADLRAQNGRKEPWKLKSFGIGNELWGCGGSMRPEYAADLTRRYSTFIKGGVEKYASGPNIDDVNWTEVMMREAGWMFSGIGMHYYTIPTTNWGQKGAASGFPEKEYAGALFQTLRMEALISAHSAVMDKYDKEKRVNLAVDEWGVWLDQEKGSHDGFLYQQNSLRDAIIASLNFDVFAKHADRVHQTNIAQMINVLQAMMLTDGAKMVRTPTYYAYQLYLPYHDAKVLPTTLKSPTYVYGEMKVPTVSASAVRGKDGLVHVALTNVDPKRPVTVRVSLSGTRGASVSGTVLNGPAVDSINTFDRPSTVGLAPYSGAIMSSGVITATLAPHSITMLDVR